MDENDILDNPGAFANEGTLPQDDIGNLQADFTPSLDNLLTGDNNAGPSIANEALQNSGSPMDDIDTTDLAGLVAGDLGSDGSVNSANDLFGSLGSDGLSSLNLNPLVTGLSNIGQGLASAFLVNPQNAQTQEQENLANAQVSSLLSSQLFGYLLIGAVLFIVYSLFSRE